MSRRSRAMGVALCLAVALAASGCAGGPPSAAPSPRATAPAGDLQDMARALNESLPTDLGSLEAAINVSF